MYICPSRIFTPLQTFVYTPPHFKFLEITLMGLYVISTQITFDTLRRSLQALEEMEIWYEKIWKSTWCKTTRIVAWLIQGDIKETGQVIREEKGHGRSWKIIANIFTTELKAELRSYKRITKLQKVMVGEKWKIWQTRTNFVSETRSCSGTIEAAASSDIFTHHPPSPRG